MEAPGLLVVVPSPVAYPTAGAGGGPTYRGSRDWRNDESVSHPCPRDTLGTSSWASSINTGSRANTYERERPEG